jgi:hypothetical protein
MKSYIALVLLIVVVSSNIHLNDKYAHVIEGT